MSVNDHVRKENVRTGSHQTSPSSGCSGTLKRDEKTRRTAVTLTGPVCWGRTFQGPIQAVRVVPSYLRVL